MMRFVVEGTELVGTADFQIDGDVDNADLTIWSANFGLQTGNIATGDADSDEDTDGNDFLVWQRQFGSSFSEAGYRDLAVAPTVVPEPVGQLVVWGLASGGLVLPARRWNRLC